MFFPLCFHTDNLGFVHMCVVCPAPLASERNLQRQIPIPDSTITDMEQRLELPDPGRHHWEEQGLVIRNEGTRDEFLQSAWSVHVHKFTWTDTCTCMCSLAGNILYCIGLAINIESV